MGPVSFESLPAGPTRDEALRVAGLLDAAGVRIVSIIDDGESGGGEGSGHDARFRIVLRSADLSAARSAIEADEGGSPAA